MSAKIISLINNKGGVGKTTSTGVIAELLAYLGAKVLCVICGLINAAYKRKDGVFVVPITALKD